MFTKHVIPVSEVAYPVHSSGTAITVADTYADMFTAGVPNTASHYIPEGGIAFFDADNGKALDRTGTTDGSSALASRWFAAYKKSGVVYSTPIINKAYRTALTKGAYVAPVAKNLKIGNIGSSTADLTLASTPVEGDVLSIRVIDLTKPYWDGRRERLYQYVYKSGDTRSGAVTSLIALINADSKKIVTASTSHSSTYLGIQLLADTAGNDFDAVPEDALENSLKTVTVANVKGYGTAAQAIEWVKEGQAHEGIIKGAKDADLLWTVPTGINTALTYTTYVCTFIDEAYKDQVNPGDTIRQELLIIVPTGSTAGNCVPVIDAMIAAGAI